MKRFTATEKWNDPWFRGLTPIQKLTWLWLVDNCDNIGLIDPDWGLASFQIGEKVDESLLEAFGKRIERVMGKLFIVKFVEFQCGHLSNECKPHKPIMKALRKNGLFQRVAIPLLNPIDTLTVKGMDTLQEKEQEKDQEKEKDYNLESTTDCPY